MKNDDTDFMDWLHRIRRESEEERQRLGLSYAERLARAEQVADGVTEELASQPLVARDKPADPKDRQP
ncbi:MAG: hypothetical protein NTX53_09755 [candidate division WOR-3 bacterium]|nr:hypothetical protein [candidate division WOR-3 bacterium]